jgi:hypothetical protein
MSIRGEESTTHDKGDLLFHSLSSSCSRLVGPPVVGLARAVSPAAKQYAIEEHLVSSRASIEIVKGCYHIRSHSLWSVSSPVGLLVVGTARAVAPGCTRSIVKKPVVSGYISSEKSTIAHHLFYRHLSFSFRRC